MRIAFDAGALAGFRGGGIEELVVNQFGQMIHMFPNVEFYPFDLFGEAAFGKELSGNNVHYTHFYMGKNAPLRQYSGKYQKLMGELVRNFLKENKIDVFYITAPFLSTPDIGHNVLYQKEWFDGVTVVATLYDIIPYVMRDRYLASAQEYKWYMSCVEMLQWADRIIAISNSAKDDAVHYLGFDSEVIDVAYPGVSERFKVQDIPEREKAALYKTFKISGAFIMCSASADVRKNTEGAIEGYLQMSRELQEKYQLVVVGRLAEEVKQRHLSKVQAQGLDGRVVFSGYVTDTQIVQLYNLASLVLFPSLYEGFGLPILEAWACGSPVAASENSSLGEIVGTDGVTFDPNQPADIARALEYALTEADLEELQTRGMERVKEFTWTRTAQATMASIEKAYSARRMQQSEKANVALVFLSGESLTQEWMNVLSMLAKSIRLTVCIDSISDSWDENIEILPVSRVNGKNNCMVVYVCPDRIRLRELALMRRIPGKWLILDEAMDELVGLIAKGKTGVHDAANALFSKMRTYFSNGEQKYEGTNEIYSVATAVITADPDRRMRFAQDLSIPVFGIYPNERLCNWDGSMQETALNNLCTALSHACPSFDRVGMLSDLCTTFAKHAYTNTELRALSRMLGTALGTEGLMGRQMRKVSGHDQRIGVSMVTSWNTKCGIAEFTKYFVTAVQDKVDFTIFPNRAPQLLGPEDKLTAPRCWDFHGPVEELARRLRSNKNPVVHIQYTEGFFTSEGLCRLIELLTPEKTVFITCHNSKYLTAETEEEKEILSRAKFIVHQELDQENLLALGIPAKSIQRVPLGQPCICQREAASVRERLGIAQHAPVVGSYGFLLPHKGIEKVIEAVGLLKERYPNILYIACCSLYDADVSREYYAQCMSTVKKLKLEKNVRLITDFLEPEESILSLQACDVLVMAYDETGESASGAVRFCLAAKRPLVTTEQAIFDEFSDCAVQIATNTPEQIVTGIETAMGEAVAMRCVENMEKKIRQTNWETVGGEYLSLYEGRKEE